MLPASYKTAIIDLQILANAATFNNAQNTHELLIVLSFSSKLQ